MSRRGAGPGFLAVALGLLASLGGGAAAPPRFRKLSEHYFYLAGTGGSGNVGALVTEDGVLLVDTPAEGDVAAALEALRRVTPKPVRWLVNTDLHAEHTGGNAYFLAHNALVVGRREPAAPAEPHGVRLAFDSQMRLFPGGVEARIGHMTPMKRAGRPEEIAAMAAFLASDDSSFVYGQCYAVDGGVSSTHPHGRIAL